MKLSEKMLVDASGYQFERLVQLEADLLDAARISAEEAEEKRQLEANNARLRAALEKLKAHFGENWVGYGLVCAALNPAQDAGAAQEAKP